MFPDRLVNLALLTLDDARQRKLKIVTAESCTGGLLAGLLTEIAGSSDVFERGYVTYSNRAKHEILGVAGDVLADDGAVSEPVARMMAEGALEASRANIAVAITGIAGPGGGTAMKPVGTIPLSRIMGHPRPAVLGEIMDEEFRAIPVTQDVEDVAYAY